MAERKQYPLLDVMKFFLIVIIMLAHTANEHAHLVGFWHYALSIYNFGVPFCFACSGYLFKSKLDTLTESEKTKYFFKYSIRLGKMYLAWSVIYITFTLFSWVLFGVTADKVLSTFQTWIVYSTYSTIWFVPALWIGISSCYVIFSKIDSHKVIFIVLFCLFVVGNLMGSYNHIMTSNSLIAAINDIYISIFRTWRNGFFNGIPYVALGFLVAKSTNKLSISLNILLVLVSVLAVLSEAIVVKLLHLSNMTDMLFMLAPAIYFLLNLAVKVEVKSNTVFIWMRNLSMLVFLGQRLFLSAIQSVSLSYSQWIESMSPIAIMIVIPAMVLVFSWVIIILTKRIPILKNLW